MRIYEYEESSCMLLTKATTLPTICIHRVSLIFQCRDATIDGRGKVPNEQKTNDPSQIATFDVDSPETVTSFGLSAGDKLFLELKQKINLIDF